MKQLQINILFGNLHWGDTAKAPAHVTVPVCVIKAAVIEQLLEGDEERYYVMRDREILVSEMVFDIPHCIKFFTHFEENGNEYFVYEIATGGDLSDFKNRQPKKRFTEVSARKYLRMIAISIHGMHKKRIVHRDIKPDNIMLSDNTENAETKAADFGTVRLVDANLEFKPEKNETINQTVAGSGFYMSPEMKSEKPNGLKTDVWSFAITIGVLFGLDNVCPSDYRTGVAGFIKDSFASKNDMLLHRGGIYLSPIIKDLVSNMLLLAESKRFNMQQVLDHKYFDIEMSEDAYSKGYAEWLTPEVQRLTSLVRKEEEALSKVSEANKAAFLKMNDASKEYYLTETEEDASNQFIKLAPKVKDYFLTVEKDKRQLFYSLLQDEKVKFTSHPNEAREILLNITEEGRTDFLSYTKATYDETIK